MTVQRTNADKLKSGLIPYNGLHDDMFLSSFACARLFQVSSFRCTTCLSFCMGVSAVDFVVHLPSNRWFFRQNCCISRIVLLGNTTVKLSATTIAKDGNEKIKKLNKNLYKRKTFLHG